MTSTSAIISTAPIVGGSLLVVDKALATLPLALQFVAMALTTFPASLYMGRVGRKIGFITGAIIGASGGALGTYAIISSDFTLFCIASLLTAVSTDSVITSGSPPPMLPLPDFAARPFSMFWPAASWPHS